MMLICLNFDKPASSKALEFSVLITRISTSVFAASTRALFLGRSYYANTNFKATAVLVAA